MNIAYDITKWFAKKATAPRKLGLEAAYFTGKIKAEGELGKALMLNQLI